MNRSRQQQGFTLIELIAAITLLAVLTTILMGTVRGAERSTSAANDAVERTEQYARTQAFLREHISGVLPMRWRREVSQPLKFNGKSSTLTYFAPVTSQIAEGGVMWWQLAVAKSQQKSQLVLRRQASDPDEKAVPDLSAAEQTFQLCRFNVAWGMSSLPKRCMLPSGNCRVKAPWRSFCRRRSTVRAAAGVPGGMVTVVGAVALFVLFMVRAPSGGMSIWRNSEIN